jgi:hypothetical protein
LRFSVGSHDSLVGLKIGAEAVGEVLFLLVVDRPFTGFRSSPMPLRNQQSNGLLRTGGEPWKRDG